MTFHKRCEFAAGQICDGQARVKNTSHETST